MPEKGWRVLTVKEDTADKIKQLSQERSVSIDRVINQLLNPEKRGWVACEECGTRLKAENLREHTIRVHKKVLIE